MKTVTPAFFVRVHIQDHLSSRSKNINSFGWRQAWMLDGDLFGARRDRPNPGWTLDGDLFWARRDTPNPGWTLDADLFWAGRDTPNPGWTLDADLF